MSTGQVTTCSYCPKQAVMCSTMRDGGRIIVIRFCEDHVPRGLSHVA